jgi:hypothetical protein
VPPPGPLSAETLGAHPIYLPHQLTGDRLDEELRRSGFDPKTADARAREESCTVFLPTVHVWLRSTPPVLAWLAEEASTGLHSYSFQEGQREDVDTVILVLSTTSDWELDIPVPTALVEIVARASMLAKDPMLLAIDLSAVRLEPQWWARYVAEEPELLVTLDALNVRRSLKFQATKHLDLPPTDSYFDDDPEL